MKTFSTHFMTIEPVCIVWNMTLQHHIDKVIFTLCLPFLKCGYNPLKQGYTPYGPYLVIIPVTLPNFNWQGGANLWEQRVDCNKVMYSGIPGNKALDYYIVDYVAYPYLLHPTYYTLNSSLW